MNHKKRGVAIIFNHFEFDIPHTPARRGTQVDCDAMETSLKDLDFEVIIFNELKANEIEMRLNEVAARDHTNNDCLVVVAMSHGESNVILAKDKAYQTEILWESFKGDKCRTLIGKPKLFFIQACRGKKYDSGVEVPKDEVDSAGLMPPNNPIMIPSTADFLVMFSTYDDHFSFRNPAIGSWFIQSLCIELNIHGKTLEIQHILCKVTRRVAFCYTSSTDDKESNEKKQCPKTVSTLTKELFFTPKIPYDGVL